MMVIVLSWSSGTCVIAAWWAATEGNWFAAALNAALAPIALWRAIQTHRGHP